MAEEIVAFVIVAVFFAEARIHELLREHLDHKRIVAAFETALERQVHYFRIVVAEDNVLRFNVLHILFLLLALLDVAVEFAVLGDRMAPEFAAAARFLADFELDALLFLVFR